MARTAKHDRVALARGVVIDLVLDGYAVDGKIAVPPAHVATHLSLDEYCLLLADREFPETYIGHSLTSCKALLGGTSRTTRRHVV